MGATAIEWTEQVWNPVAGCTWASAGCDHCYAAVMTRRLEAMGQADYAGLTTAKHFNGQIRTLPAKLAVPLRRRKPTRWFVNSMSDLFHKDVDSEFIADVFGVMALCQEHTFQILTKRPERMAEFCNTVNVRDLLYDGMERMAELHGIADFQYDETWPLPNVWLGTSVENQEQADNRIPELLGCPAAVRFLSCEPLLGPVTFDQRLVAPIVGTSQHGQRFIDWVIVGGESGHGARPMHPDWARSLRDQCQAAGVPFFFNQWGAWLPGLQDGAPLDSQQINCSDDAIRVGKKAAGRLLDGREWNEMPEVTRG